MTVARQSWGRSSSPAARSTAQKASLSSTLRGVFSVRFLRAIATIQSPEKAKRFLRLDRYWLPEIAEPLLARIDELVPLKPQVALQLAEIAQELVGRIRNPSAELRFHAVCSLGVAQRETGNLAEAETTLARAERLVAACGIAQRAMFDRQQAILRIYQGNGNDALRLAQSAVDLDRSLEEVPAKSLLTLGGIHYFRDEYEESTACWKEVLEKTDPTSDIYAFAMQNLAATFARKNLPIKEIVPARKLLETVRDRIKGIRQTPVRYVVWYSEGLLHSSLNEFKAAVRHLDQARTGFLKLEQVGDYARATIDLVDVFVRKGNAGKAQTILERAAREIAGRPGYGAAAKIFESALEGRITDVPEYLRERISTALAQRVEVPVVR